LSLFLGNRLSNVYSISDIAKNIGAAYPHTHAAVTALIEQDILHSYAIGKSILCAPNLYNDATRALLCIAENQQQELQDNVQNVQRAVQQLAINNPNILSVLLRDDGITFIVNDTSEQAAILKQTELLNLQFYTPKELAAELKQSMTELDATMLVGYDRLLLLLAPHREQLMFNHAKVLRGQEVQR
jgi:hypothetical protein